MRTISLALLFAILLAACSNNPPSGVLVADADLLGGCQEDLDCKGNRICVAHQCVNPPTDAGNKNEKIHSVDVRHYDMATPADAYPSDTTQLVDGYNVDATTTVDTRRANTADATMAIDTRRWDYAGND